MTLICPPVYIMQSTVAAGLSPAESVFSLLESCHAIDDETVQMAGRDLRCLEDGWMDVTMGVSPPFAMQGVGILGDSEEVISLEPSARFDSLEALAAYLNGSPIAASLARGALGTVDRQFAMTVLAHHLDSLTGGDLSAVMTTHKGLQIGAMDISYLLYSGEVDAHSESALCFSPLRVWEKLGEITNHEGQIVPLSNNLLMAEALCRLSRGQSEINKEDGLYTGEDLAFSFADAALALYPNHADALYQRAKIEEEDVEGALGWLDRALKVDPNHFYAWEYLGNVCEFAGMPHEAREPWERALSIMERKTATERRLGFSTGAMPPNEKWANFQMKLGVLCEALGYGERARYHYDKVHERVGDAFCVPERLLPGSVGRLSPAGVFYRMGQVFQRIGLAGEADERFGMAAQLDPRFAE